MCEQAQGGGTLLPLAWCQSIPGVQHQWAGEPGALQHSPSPVWVQVWEQMLEGKAISEKQELPISLGIFSNDLSWEKPCPVPAGVSLAGGVWWGSGWMIFSSSLAAALCLEGPSASPEQRG